VRKIGIGTILLAALLGFAAYGLWSFAGQSDDAERAGAVVAYGPVGDQSAPEVTVAALLAGKHTGPATVQGSVVDMGPTMGCWLVVDDGTGQLLVQTEPMIYIDQSMRGQTIRASGELAMLNGGMGFSGPTPALLTPGIVASDGTAG
jgi:hypothetical protein